MREVSKVVTGVGLVTGFGGGVTTTRAALEAARCALAHHDGEPWPSALVAGEAARWPDGPSWADGEKYAGRAAHLAVAAAVQAVASAALPLGSIGDGRGGTVVSVGPDLEWESLAAVLATEDERSPALRIYQDLPDFHVLRLMPSVAAQFVVATAGFDGPTVTTSRPHAAGIGALVLASGLLDSEEVDAVLVAGADPRPSVPGLAARERSEPLALDARMGLGPFDRHASGSFVGEGAAALLLEREERARARGARPLARLLAAEVRCASQLGDALGEAVDAALAAAQRRPEILWAHGEAVPTVDRLEATVLGRLGVRATTATKGAFGGLPNAGALADLVLAIDFAARAQLPPVTLLEQPDDAAASLGLVCRTPRALAGARTVLVSGMSAAASCGGAAMLAVGETE